MGKANFSGIRRQYAEMKKQLLHITCTSFFIMCILCLLIIPTMACAQDACNNLTANAEWNSGIQEVTKLVQGNFYPEAQKKAKALSRICDQSPVLHYIQGKIAEGLDQKTDALLHYQKASEYTYQYAVNPDMAKKIWYARYENEHPERTEKSIKEAEQKSEIQLNQLNQINTKNQDLIEQANEERTSTSYRLMWTGVGIGVAGLVMAGTGLGLVFDRNAAIVEYRDFSGGTKQYTQRPNPVFVTSYALIASGAAFAITGSILTGIFGYQYSKFKDEIDYSFAIMPNHVAFSIQF